jgi:hypothetical protein
VNFFSQRCVLILLSLSWRGLQRCAALFGTPGVKKLTRGLANSIDRFQQLIYDVSADWSHVRPITSGSNKTLYLHSAKEKEGSSREATFENPP